MELLELVWIVALGTVASLLVCCVGTGGVIVVPALVYLAGYSLPTAIAAAMCTFIVSGPVGRLVSALTGTGGPLVLVPILVALDVPTLASIGLAQAVQLPVAAAAAGGFLISGLLDVPLGMALAAGIAVGTWIGAKGAHALPTATLRRLVAILLVIVRGAMLLRLAANA